MTIYDEPKIDCHCHVFDPARFPYGEDSVYRPAGQEIGTAAQFTRVLDAYGVRHALLVGPNSGYEQDNRCMLDAIANGRGRFKGIAVVPNDIHDDALRSLKAAGIVGVAFNATFHGADYYRAAVREAKLHGTDWVKIYTTQDFVGDEYSVFKPDGTLVNSPSLTEEEVMAITDEAHRLGLKVACHTYGGEGQLSCLKAGVDAPNHLTDLDDASLKLLVDKKLPFELTIDDLVALEPADLKKTGGRNSRLKMAEQAFKKAYAAGVPFVFGSGATSADVPHGKQADQFAYFIKWGMERLDALKMPFLPTARMLNYNWVDQIGSLEKGKYADIIAVAGNPLADISEMQRVRFVMKGGYVVRNELSSR